MSAKSPPILDLVTPEGMALRFTLAPLMGRAIALGIDLTIVLILWIITVIVGIIGGAALSFEFVVPLLLIALFVLRPLYFIGFETFLQGATPGKLFLRLRVLSRDGGRLRVESLVLRNLMRDVEIFLPLTVMLSPESLMGPAPMWLRIPAGVWAFAALCLPIVTKERVRSGDVVAGTVVVAVPHAELTRDMAAGASGTIRFTVAQLSQYGELELETLAELLREFERGVRPAAALVPVAETIARKIGFSDYASVRDPHQFLVAFYSEQRRALERQLLFGKRFANKFVRGEGTTRGSGRQKMP